MHSKGSIQVGMDADIVVFDPAPIRGNATSDDSNRPATGVQTLLVGGQFVIQNSLLVLDADNGQTIRRHTARG